MVDLPAPAPQEAEPPRAEKLLAAFDYSVAGVHLLDGPRPSYPHPSCADWHDKGIRQGLKIARTILEENLLVLDAEPLAQLLQRDDVAAENVALRANNSDVKTLFDSKAAECAALSAKVARSALAMQDAPMKTDRWMPIETAPKGYDGERFHYVLFYGVSRSRSLMHPVIVSGYMGSGGRPVVSYQYALNITHWMPLPELPAALATSQKGA